MKILAPLLYPFLVFLPFSLYVLSHFAGGYNNVYTVITQYLVFAVPFTSLFFTKWICYWENTTNPSFQDHLRHSCLLYLAFFIWEQNSVTFFSSTEAFFYDYWQITSDFPYSEFNEFTITWLFFILFSFGFGVLGNALYMLIQHNRSKKNRE